MGFWDFLKRPGVDQVVFSPRVTHVGSAHEWLEALNLDGMTAAQMWRTQPHLRTVVSFRARNVAQLGLHVFQRVSDTDRRRDQASPLAQALRRPDTHMTAYDLIFALVGDLDLYDRAYWLVGTSADDGRPVLRRLPPAWVEPVFSGPFTVKEYRVFRGQQVTTVPADQVLAFTGYAPASPVGASPTVEALKETLREQIEAASYRAQVWKRGGRVSAVLERPKDAPEWSSEARDRFREDWYAKFTGNGPRAGGTPILEDGMTLRRIDFNAQEQQFVEHAKLALATVASAFHVNPTMVGLLDNANYSNVREFRRMLYGDTLGPLLAQIEARINTFLLPMLGMDADTFYAEFNLAEKLQGSFEEQASVMQTLVGAPLMTRNEGRARFNLPQIDGGDLLVTPLNVLEGGQASPTDSGSQNRELSRGAAAKTLRLKARAPKTYEKRVRGVLESFFKRQAASVRSALGAKADEDWWDGERWDSELADDLNRLALLVSQQVAESTLDSLGVSPDEYDTDRTLAFLRAVSERIAGSINTTTRVQIEQALADAEDDDRLTAVGHVFEVAQESRSEQSALTLVTTFSAFGTTEAAHQVSGGNATKTWVTTSGNPRSSHAAMNGETVGIREQFSNGASWPGDALNLDVDEVAGCQCDVIINL